MTDSTTTTPAAGAAPSPNDPKKAAVWFKKASECEKTRQYDYALTSYLSGLQLDLDNVEMHKKLIQLGKTRKANGGKAGSGIFGESLHESRARGRRWRSSTPSSRWPRIRTTRPSGRPRWKASGKAGAPNAAKWYGDQFLPMVRAKSAGSAKKAKLMTLMYHYEALEVFDMGRLAAEEALRMDPSNLELTTKVKNLAAQQVTKKGKYESATEDGSNFTNSIENFDKQKQMLRDNADVKSEEHIEQRIQRGPREVAEGTDQHRPAAGARKRPAQEGSRRHRERGRQASGRGVQEDDRVPAPHPGRRHPHSPTAAEAARLPREARRPGPAARQEGRDAGQIRRRREAGAVGRNQGIQERSAKYPTDRDMRFELGRRCLEAGQLDDAIDNLQAAESAPKLRIKALNLLGTAFIQKEWFEEAVDSFRRAIEAYEGLESDEMRPEPAL